MDDGRYIIMHFGGQYYIKDTLENVQIGEMLDRIEQVEVFIDIANDLQAENDALLTENRELRAAHLEIYRLVMFQSSGYALEIGNIIHKALGLKDDESPRDYLRTAASAESEA